MDVLTIDVESYWDSDFSLSKLSPLEYVLGDKFELISMAHKLNGGPTTVTFGEKAAAKALKKFDLSRMMLVGHNMSGFDSYILAYRMGVRPAMWGCTMAMARPLHAKTVGLSLGKLVSHYKLGEKDNAVLLNTKGKRLADFTPSELEAMADYNRADTDQCYALFRKLAKHYTAKELWQIDALTRMRTEPQFVLDIPLLETALSIERDRKFKALLDLASLLGTNWDDDNPEDGRTIDDIVEDVRQQLASAIKFSALLEKLGVEVPMKASPTNPDVRVPALAKTDEAFIALQEHDNPLVAAAARMRLDVKSTLLETRIEKFLTAGRLAGGRLPITLRYCGADTTGRDSGEEYNPQNLPRINPDKPKHTDALRRSLRAPDGYTVIVADQSGIELRVNHFLWQVPSSMALYRENPAKADLYRAFAAESLFCVEPEQITKSQRQVGKVAQLGLGFGAGAATFQIVARTMGGIDMPLEADEGLSAKMVVTAWRAAYPEIVGGWKLADTALRWISQGRDGKVDPWGLVRTCSEGFVLPSGRLIRYPDLRYLDESGVVREFFDGNLPHLSDEQYEKLVRRRVGWWYARGRHRARLTGPKAVENKVQALARDSIFDCAVEFYRQTKLYPALRVHDELVYVVPTPDANRLLDLLQGIMRTPPKWWPELVVWSEGSSASTYGDAK